MNSDDFDGVSVYDEDQDDDYLLELLSRSPNSRRRLPTKLERVVQFLESGQVKVLEVGSELNFFQINFRFPSILLKWQSPDSVPFEVSNIKLGLTLETECVFCFKHEMRWSFSLRLLGVGVLLFRQWGY